VSFTGSHTLSKLRNNIESDGSLLLQLGDLLMTITRNSPAAPAVGQSVGLPLAQIVPPKAYQARRQHLFPSPVSFAWWARKHRAELVQLGALLKVANHLVVHEDRMDEAVLTLGVAAME